MLVIIAIGKIILQCMIESRELQLLYKSNYCKSGHFWWVFFFRIADWIKYMTFLACDFPVSCITINNINSANHSAPDANFNNKCLFSDAQGQNTCIWKSKTYSKDEVLINQKGQKQKIAKAGNGIRALHKHDKGDIFLNLK